MPHHGSATGTPDHEGARRHRALRAASQRTWRARTSADGTPPEADRPRLDTLILLIQHLTSS